MDRETITIAVCATNEASLAELATLLGRAGRWSVMPIHWPNPTAWDAARDAHAFVIDTENICAELIGNLRARRAPMIAIGAPVVEIAPEVWLLSRPSSSMVGTLLDHLIEGEREAVMTPSWRRKSDMIIGNSPQLRSLRSQLDQLASSQTPVLITGESGVGKELVARSLHFCGPRANEAFITINCAAIPESLFEAELFGYQRGAFTGAINAKPGAFEMAHDGTLFLDEIGELPLGLQAKLLRVIETGEVQRIGATEPKKVKLRLVSATNRDLAKEVETGRFREDLYYRIHVYPVHVPSLRDRAEDIAPIAMHQLSSISQRENRPALRLTPAALEKLLAHTWPGNVRELLNMLERAALLAPDHTIDAEHIIFAVTQAAEPAAMPLVYRDAKMKFEVDYYTQLLRLAGGNISLAAKLGQKTRKEIYDALKRLDLDPASYRAADE